MLRDRTAQDLVQIVRNGGGLDIDASALPQQVLVQLAANAAAGGARLTLRGLGGRAQQDLVQIAANGKGNVVLAD